MIEIVEGVGVGAGKSYYVTTRIARTLAKGGSICATDKFQVIWERLVGPLSQSETAKRLKSFGSYRQRVEGMVEYCRDEYGVEIERSQWITLPSDQTERLHELTPQGTEDCPVTIILDEAQDKLNARDTRDNGKRDLFAWMCQSRHDDNDLIFITQNALNVDSQIRRLCSFITRVRDMTKFPIGGVKCGWLKYFVVNVCDQNGKTQLERHWIKHDPRVFGAYVSKSQRSAHQRTGVIARKNLQKTVPTGLSKPMRFLIGILILCVCVLAYGAYKMGFSNPLIPKGAKTATPAPAVPTREVTHDAPAAPAAPGAAPGEKRPGWRTVTRAFRGGDMQSYLHTDGGAYETGQMSADGYVEQIAGQVAKLRSPTGELLYIVAESRGAPVVAPGVVGPVLGQPGALAGPVVAVPAVVVDQELSAIRDRAAGVSPFGSDADGLRIGAGMPLRKRENKSAAAEPSPGLAFRR